MIKLHKTYPAPTSLSSQECTDTLNAISEKIGKGVKVTSDDYKSLYGKQDVRAQLMTDQHKKCAYCEKTLEDEPRHVEHYRPKSKYYNLAFTWNNLFGCCWACNNKKGSVFPVEDETKRFTSQEIPLLINPYIEDPAEFIAFHEDIATPKQGLTGLKKRKAEETIKLLLERKDLQDRRRENWVLFDGIRKAFEATNLPELQALLGEFTKDNHEFAGMFRNQQ